MRVSEVASLLPSDVLRQITSQANELHDVICESYSCSCRRPHVSNLGALSVDDLNGRELFELVFSVSEELASEIMTNDPTLPMSLESQFDSTRYAYLLQHFAETLTE